MSLLLMNTTTTFVTAFYNLEKGGVSILTYEKEVKDYFRRIDFLMSVPGPLVVFTEQEYVAAIVSAANQYRSKFPTQIILKEWNDLYWVKRFDSILTVCQTKSLTRTEHNDSPEFIPIMWEKLLFVQEVIASGKYNTEFFAWIDFGLGRITHYGDYMKAFDVTSPKIRFMLNNQQIYQESYYQDDVNVSTCAAGYITGSPEYFQKLVTVFMSEAHHCLTVLQCCPREESILSCLTLKHPEMFGCYYGDENACMLTNYPNYYYCTNSLLHNLDKCCSIEVDNILSRRCFDRIVAVSESILTLFDQNKTNITPTMLFVVFQAFFLVPSQQNEYEKRIKMAKRFRSFLLFSEFRQLYDQNKSLIESLVSRAEVKPPTISIVCLIYKSVKYLQFVYDQVQKYTNLNNGALEFFFVANDASIEVLDYLRSHNLPHRIFTNTPENIAAHNTTEYYLNNVYRAWNFGGASAQGKYIVFINSDMAFSPGWLEALLDKDPEHNAITSRLLESGRYRSGTYGKTYDCGQYLRDYNEAKFLSGVELLRQPGRTEEGGLYMPLLIRRDYFLKVGGYPEGNVVPNSDIFNPVIVKKGVVDCIPGDEIIMSKLKTIGVKHITAFDSIVYHFQNGEMFE